MMVSRRKKMIGKNAKGGQEQAEDASEMKRRVRLEEM